MIREILIGNVSQLQFGSYVQVQIVITIDGVQTYNQYVAFDANKFATVYDTQNVNIVVLHFGNVSRIISNADFNKFVYATIDKTDPIDLAQAVITDIAQYTT